MNKLSFLIMFALLVGCHYGEPDPELIRLFGDHCELLGHARDSAEFNDCVIRIGQKK